MDYVSLSSLVPIPAVYAHKYSRGKAVVVAGAPAYPGAACLAAQASQFAGAGYTQVFTAIKNVSLLQMHRPSLVVQSFASYDPSMLFSKGNPGAVVIGPGFEADNRELEQLVRLSIKKANRPLLIDGGGLSALTKPKAHAALQRRREKGRATVLTPHEGEAKRLGDPFGIKLAEADETPEAQRQARIKFAHALAMCYESVVVLKGRDTYIATPDVSDVYVMEEGSSVLSKAGTGDVLAGLIGGFMAQGMDLFDACRLGTSVHAAAGLAAAKRMGIVSACAEEVLACVPAVIMSLTENR